MIEQESDQEANDKSERVVVIRMSDLKPIAPIASDAPAPTAPAQTADSATTPERAAAATLRAHK